MLDESDGDEALQMNAREANAKVMQVLVLGFEKTTLVNTIAMSKSEECLVGKA